MRTSILVAESDPALAGTFVEILSSGECNVKAVSSLEVAIMEMEKEVPDVMLISDQLSGGRGMELCREVRQTRGEDDVPAIVFLTGDSKRQELQDPSVRVDAWLRRPVDPILLRSAVESLLDRRKKRTPSNPLTRLPGPLALSEEIERRRASGENFATCIFCLSTGPAEAYRIKYGQLKFTGMVRLAAHTVSACALTHGGKGAFVAHRGTLEEPEFVVLIDAEKTAELEKAASEEFEANAEPLYDRVDREEGCLVVADQNGRRAAKPFVSLQARARVAEKVGSTGT
ncbi:MAG: hypothetical protein AMJ46_08540 [Latescibacteria bacterium DG_63]|nr:MAG: hypothetical protein AMJ46_08540 [Latescibacteria bacterium DG_63]